MRLDLDTVIAIAGTITLTVVMPAQIAFFFNQPQVMLFSLVSCPLIMSALLPRNEG